LGGISTPHHPDVGTAAVFVYDGVPGGVGLARLAFEIYPDLIAKVASHLAACPCAEGCPSCIHSPKCGSRNSPLDKAGALALARSFASDRRHVRRVSVAESVVVNERREKSKLDEPPRNAAPEGHTLVFDLETQKLADEVGGWDNKRAMRMSVGVVYDMEDGVFREYMENETPALYDDLRRARLVIGFNIKSFDYEVLSAYVPREQLDQLRTLDLLEHVHAALKRRVRLDDLARATLGKGKSADGVEAVRWFRERDYAKLIEYCRRDVEVTKELYEFGVANGYVLFPSIQGTMKLPARW
jgi:DEAD/DEAH box helicase domain-containing protein